MEFYPSFEHLLGAHFAVVIVLSIAIFLMMVEAVLLVRRDGSYPWKNASTSIGVALGHLVA
ncbi:MAG: hypothetical protein KIT25_09140 [Enhydrobacter sp.]|nr:MAG: hypothetical protein KIT25_09140 [Enhydrobacter sp.]